MGRSGDRASACISALAAVSPGKNVGRRGEDIVRGTTLLEPGRVLRPQDLGVLSSIGQGKARVVRRPRVRLAVTGNELLPSGSRPHGFHIADANGPMLAALIERDGGVVDFPGLVRDDRDAILEALQADADIVIVSGGSSVGIEDLAPMLVAQHGELAVHGIAMRPSSPTGLGRIGHRLVFLLPGNPVSSLCAYDFFAGRAIRALGGRSKAWPYRAITRHTESQDQFADRPPRLRPREDRGRAGRAARHRRRVAAVVDHARGRLRDRWRRQRGLRGRRRSEGLALWVSAVCVNRSNFSRSSTAMKRSGVSGPRLTARRAGSEVVPLDAALGRVLAADVVSPVDVPSFDRSNVDGFAVVAEDTFGASEEVPRSVLLGEEEIHTGIVPTTVIHPGKAVSIATGGMVPRGADAVVMVEHAEVRGGELRIARAVTAGSGVSFAGTDITAGETVLRRGQLLTSRDTGVLAAIGVANVNVWRKPIVAILSTGDEIIAPGEEMQPAKVYDSNGQVLADAVRELGGEPRRLGITHDDVDGFARTAAIRARICRHRAAVGWNEQGRGRCVLSRCRRT